VRGAVNKPGVYALPPGSRVQDALNAAGGTQTLADLSMLNLARKVADGEQLLIPTRPPSTPTAARIAADTPTSAPQTTPTGARLINLNTATLADLDTLPGIGPTLAQRILDYRAQYGSFKTTADIKKVRGIGDTLFEQIKDLITVGD
jgi:competence protein ComEA